LKGSSVLTLQNRVSLNNLTTIRSLGAGTLTARAWETLRAAAHIVALNRAAAPILAPAQVSPECGDGTPQFVLMRRGVERC
jgi:hypothetical protein